MKIIRFRQGQTIKHGIVHEDTVFSIEGNVYGDFVVGKELCSLSDVRLLPPTQPKIVVGVGRNYYRFVEETGRKMPTEPVLFFKPSSSVVGHLDNIVYPEISSDVEYGAELAVVMKYETRNVPEDRALDYILGYTCALDLATCDLADEHPTRIKSFYTFCPLGPYITTNIDGQNLRIESRVNSILKQDGSTSDMIFSISKIISYITKFMALEPGDVILTGSPRKETEINIGDTIEVEIEGIGILRNTVTKY